MSESPVGKKQKVEASNDVLVGSIDQGTSSSRFFLFNSKGDIIHSHQQEFQQIYPRPGWVEHDPFVILQSVTNCIEQVFKKSNDTDLSSKIKAIGITNQRETTVVWDKVTGKPFCNAIVWLDTRTSGTCSDLIEKLDNNKDALREKCGLPIATYFSAVKLKWILENVPEVKEAAKEGRCLFGTVDSWLIWNLTGGVNGGIHVTDVTNASRTMLLNLQTLKWDQSLCDLFGIPSSVLPEIRSSAEVYGITKEGLLAGIPIAGCLGDQQAAMLGQQCLKIGQAKNTYGTGAFMLFNTGNKAVQSKHGLLTTVCFKLGPNKPAVFALEGSIAIAGAAIQWLRDNLGIINSTAEFNELANSVEDSGGVYFVPAFSGLFAPYWRPDARGVLVGLSQFVTKAHICRATLEATCYQTREILDAMTNDSGVKLSILKVDGGMSNSQLMIQSQADILGIPVEKPASIETTALGAAFAAGLATGVWKTEEDLPKLAGTQCVPQLDAVIQGQHLQAWKKAIQTSFSWGK